MTDARRDPTTLPGRPCSVASAMELIGDRWALLAVREVMFGNHRFSQIARNTGAPRDRLTARLKDLVAAGVLERRPYQDNPRREGYHLTQAGRELGPVMRSILEWGDKWAVTSAPMLLLHHDHALTPSARCGTCGEPVDEADVTREMRVSDWTLTGQDPGEPSHGARHRRTPGR